MHPIGVKLGSEKRSYPVGAGVGLRVVRVLQVISVADERLSRRGGCWVEGGGDACVAPGGGGRHTRELDEGDANVPTPHAHRSHPYGTTPSFLVCPALFSSLEAHEAQFIAPNRQGAQ